MDEVWKVIPGYEGRYEASSTGYIRRVKGKGASHSHPRYLKQSTNKRGYVRVSIIRHGKVVKPLVQVLVALAFLGPCPDAHRVFHKDLDRSNNRSDNLDYRTVAEIHRRARATQRWGIRGGRLSDAQVRFIRRSVATQRWLADAFGVSQAQISNIRARRSYREVSDG